MTLKKTPHKNVVDRSLAQEKIIITGELMKGNQELFGAWILSL